MVNYMRPGLAPIPEMDVFPSPCAEAKGKELRARFQNMMHHEWIISGGSFDDEWDSCFDNIVSGAATIRSIPGSKTKQAISWISGKIRLRSKLDASSNMNDWESWKPVYPDADTIMRDEYWSDEMTQLKGSVACSCIGPLLSKNDKRGWQAAKAKFSLKTRHLKYTLATQPWTLLKQCARMAKSR